jgi:lipopolysaccharide export system permease protein
LWKSRQLKHHIELHWRIATPMILLILGLIALPLAYIAPRQGRFGKVGYALLIYIVYLNLMAVTRAQLEAGTIPIAVNFWWVHAVFLVFACVLLYRRNWGVLLARTKT